MTSKSVYKIGSIVGGGIITVELAISILALSIVALPFLLLDFLGKKLFRIKEVNAVDDPEWNRTGGRGSLF